MTNLQLLEWVSDACLRTFELIADLTDRQLLGPRLAIVNPLLWEIGHVAWFQQKWVLRRDGSPSLQSVGKAKRTTIPPAASSFLDVHFRVR